MLTNLPAINFCVRFYFIRRFGCRVRRSISLAQCQLSNINTNSRRIYMCIDRSFFFLFPFSLIQCESGEIRQSVECLELRNSYLYVSGSRRHDRSANGIVCV